MEYDLEGLKHILKKGFHLKTKDGQIKRKDLAYIPKKDNRKTRQALSEIETTHNHSWFEEIYERNQMRLSSVALIYRGNEITYGEMFDRMKELAKALRAYGIQRGDEIPVCLSNTPELVYLMGAVSMIGAKINVFGPKFDEDYITRIIDGTHSKLVFIEDNHYDRLRESIQKSNASDVVLVSLMDSLEKGIHPLEQESNITKFVSSVEKYSDSYVKSMSDFVSLGQHYYGEVLGHATLDDEFSITYTSGSTNAKYPKQIVHDNRSYIMIARHHDKDMSGGIDMSKLTLLAHLPTYSNTDLISCISDSLMQGSRLALEPISDRSHFINSLIMNKPNCVIATTSYWIQAMKDALYNPEYRDLTMPYLFIMFAAGEGMSVNEEKFLNKGLRKVKAGTQFIPSFLKSSVMSAGGGDCEHGSIFYSIFRRLGEKKTAPNYREEAGLKVMDFAELAVLDENGSYCSKGELGRIVANSGCTMSRYKDDPEATRAFFITDAYGKTWGDCSIYGFLDKKNRVHIKGRIPKNGEKLPTFYINDEVLRDQTNILSAATVHVVDNDEDYYIVHFEKMPESIKDTNQIMREALLRIRDSLGDDVASRVLFREHSFEESFAVNGSGKRDFYACQAEGISEKTHQVCLTAPSQKTLKK